MASVLQNALLSARSMLELANQHAQKRFFASSSVILTLEMVKINNVRVSRSVCSVCFVRLAAALLGPPPARLPRMPG